MSPQAAQAASQASSDLATALASHDPQAIAAASNEVGQVINQYNLLPDKIKPVAAQIPQSVADGINQSHQAALDAAGQLGSETAGSFGRSIGAGSPAQVFINFGHDIVSGIAQGVREGGGDAVSAIDAVKAQMDSAVQGLVPAMQTSAREAMQAVAQAVANWGAQAVSAARNATSEIASAFRQMGSELVSSMSATMGQTLAAASAGLNALVNAFTAATNAIGPEGARAGEEFGQGLIDTLNSKLPGIRAVLNAYDTALSQGIGPILKAVGGSTAGLPGMAAGGIANSPTFIVGEEAPAHPEVVIPTNPAYHKNAVALLGAATKLIGLQAGGMTSGQGGAPAPGLFTSPDQVPKPPGFEAWGGQGLTEGWMYNRGANDEYQAVVAKIKQSAAGGWMGGAAPPGACGDWINQGLAMAGSRACMGAGCMTARVMNESSCNPGAINLSDSNARAGHPSVGIAQFVPSTFAANACPGCGDINNPVCQICASAHCDCGNCGHGGYGCAKGCIIGLRQGGIVTRPTQALIGEAGPEAVVPLGGGGTFGGDVTIHAPIVVQGNVTRDAMPEVAAASRTIARNVTQELRARGVIR
jgi:SLT domain-containing protein